jgi:hypothetical protein
MTLVSISRRSFLAGVATSTAVIIPAVRALNIYEAVGGTTLRQSIFDESALWWWDGSGNCAGDKFVRRSSAVITDGVDVGRIVGNAKSGYLSFMLRTEILRNAA